MARHSEEQVARMLADRVDAVLAGRSSPDECLPDDPELGPRLRRLLQIALNLRDAASQAEADPPGAPPPDPRRATRDRRKVK